jgi:hypothetical protein
LTIPVVLEEVVAEEDFAEEVVPVKPRRPAPRVADDEEEEEERVAQKPVRRARPVDDEDDRPRRKKRRKITRGEWADCPNCGYSDATRVRFAWWGGFVGPLFINTVRCRECDTNYNGIHGDYNTVRILIYVLVGLGFTVVVSVGAAVAALSVLK